MNITLRILHRPVPEELPKIYTNVGIDYAERVLPSITNEVLKAVVVSQSATDRCFTYLILCQLPYVWRKTGFFASLESS